MGETQTFGKIWIFLLFLDCNNPLITGKSEVDKTIYIRKLYPEEGLNVGKWII